MKKLFLLLALIALPVLSNPLSIPVSTSVPQATTSSDIMEVAIVPSEGHERVRNSDDGDRNLIEDHEQIINSDDGGRNLNAIEIEMLDNNTAPIIIANELGSWTLWYDYVSGDFGGSSHSIRLEPGEQTTLYYEAGRVYSFMAKDENMNIYIRKDIFVGLAGYTWRVTEADMI